MLKPFVWTLRLSDAEGWQFHEALRGKVMIETPEAPKFHYDADGNAYRAVNVLGLPMDEHQRRYTLYPTPGGTRLELTTGGPTDEGWHRNTTTIRQDGEVWRVELDGASQDCDGRLDRHEEGTSEGGEPEPSKLNSPITWGEASQRDHTAESMGY